ncbi:hypothetical protein [Microvirga terricola]|uniref:Uncharacterized protein n=1 Tax=Microvirga terricola TaxID=2719797 RepID=A0ABX0VAL0_9HYPH|nr:hypothetical protein [Microvirga terricola]NIX76738.1 hypothetical protein [Microvirga terricola]
MRKLLFGLLGFAALGLGTLAAQPAAADHGHGRGHAYGHRHHRPHVVYERPGYRPYRYYRPVHGYPRCWTRMQRYWNGFVWVDRPIRVCR